MTPGVLGAVLGSQYERHGKGHKADEGLGTFVILEEAESWDCSVPEKTLRVLSTCINI